MFPTVMWRGFNLISCKVGTAAGTANTGDVAIIPSTQLAPQVPATVNNPLPLANVGLSSCRESIATATNSGARNPAILGGTDALLGAMTFISNADVDYRTRLQAADLAGTNSAVALPAAVSTRNDNANGGATVLFDMLAKTDSTTNWVIGASALHSLL